MSVNHEAVAAWPPGGSPNPDLIRALTERRFAYCLAASESAADLVAADPVSGVIPLYLIQNSTLYAFDATDSTTAPSSVCLVTSDGKRFKSDVIAAPWSVLTKGTTAQPATPAVGDTYLIPTAATGVDWAGKDGKVGIYTAGGWRFAIVPLGRFLFVQDEGAFYYRNTSGVWTSGVGSILLGANSINITNVLGAKASFVVKVENQTTNAEPTATLGTNYIIGPSPTGTHWAGNAGKVAMCITAGTWTIITPAAGDEVYDKAQQNAFRFNGTAWISAVGAWVRYLSTGVTATPTFVTNSGTPYAYSSTSGPTSSLLHGEDTSSVITNYTARKVGAKLRFIYRAAFAGNTAAYTVALMQDSVSAAVDWALLQNITNIGICQQLEITTTDVLPHTYKLMIFVASGGAISGWNRSSLSVEEAA